MNVRERAQEIGDQSRRIRRAHSGVKVAGTRLIVAAAVALLLPLLPFVPNRNLVATVAVAYGASIVLFVVAFRNVIEQRRFRLVATVIDVAAVSIIVKLTGGLESTWFLLYVFPVMSVARYLGLMWSLVVALFAAATYGSATLPMLVAAEPVGTLCFRVAFLVFVAFTAAKLARTRYREEETFTELLHAADRPIFNQDEFDAGLATILKGAIRITKSDVSAVLFVNDTGALVYVQHADQRDPVDLEMIKALMVGHYHKVLHDRRPVPIAPSGFAGWLGRSPQTAKAWFGRLVPMAVGGPPFAVLGVFSRHSIHYRPDDLLKLSRFAVFVAMLQKNASVSQPLVAEADRLRTLSETVQRLQAENEARLQTLYDIGDLFRNELNLREVFDKIVNIVLIRLGSEEAAMFIWNEHEQRLIKRAVAGPNRATAEALAAIETSYVSGESLTGNVFETCAELKVNAVSSAVAHVKEYADALPSRSIKHYLGAPLVIGEEVVGVIRVLNRRSVAYLPQEGFAAISDDGFDEADLKLLVMTARLMAVAIRSAGFVEQKRYFENLVYQSPDPIIILDANKKIKHFNQACTDIWHLAEKDVMGQSPAGFYKSAEHAREISEALKGAGTIRDHPAWIRDSEGQIIPIRLSATEYRSKNGKFAGSFGVFKDARQEHQERLQALHHLSRTASHDIKNDVTTIKWYFSDLEKATQKDSNFRPVYDGIRNATNAALNKLQSLLLTAVPPPAKMIPVQIVRELESFAAAMRTRLDPAGIAFRFRAPDREALVSADSEQLRQVLANLLGNSIDAIDANPMQESGRIDVAVDLTADKAILTWRDNGIGMPEQTARDVFTAFYTTKDEGNGLGLYINKTIVNAHGGDISIRSALGSGTSITITLPLIAAIRLARANDKISANA